MGRKIAVVSGKGGVGKTTIVCGLGISLAKKGASVCLLDLDLGLNNLDVLLGVEDKVVYDLVDCVQGNCRIKQALVNVSGYDSLYILSSYRAINDILCLTDIKTITDKLASVFDYVLIDAPAGLGNNFDYAVCGCREAIVVVTPHIVSLRDADKVVSVLKGMEIDNISVLVNRIRGDMVAKKEMLSHQQIENLLKTNVIGVVPESDDINIYSGLKFDKLLKSNAEEVFNILSHNLKYDKKIIYDYEKKYKGFIGMLRRNIKRSI